MLLTPNVITLVQSSCPISCCYAEHNGTEVLRTGQGRLTTFRKLIVADTQAEVDAEILRLNLTPPPLSKSQRAAEYFRSLPPDLQAKFYLPFVALSALSSDAEKLRGITAVPTSSDAEAAAKAEFIRILS